MKGKTITLGRVKKALEETDGIHKPTVLGVRNEVHLHSFANRVIVGWERGGQVLILSKKAFECPHTQLGLSLFTMFLQNLGKKPIAKKPVESYFYIPARNQVRIGDDVVITLNPDAISQRKAVQFANRMDQLFLGHYYTSGEMGIAQFIWKDDNPSKKK